MLLMRHLDRWARTSQQASRRNAMLASTEAVHRRAEREEAEAYVAAATASYAARLDEQPVTSHTG